MSRYEIDPATHEPFLQEPFWQGTSHTPYLGPDPQAEAISTAPFADRRRTHIASAVGQTSFAASEGADNAGRVTY